MSEKKNNSVLRKIGGMKLINTGLKGVEITYETLEYIDGVPYSSQDNKKSYRPAHRELKALMKEFVTPLIELCGYPLPKEDVMGKVDITSGVNVADFEVTGIVAGTDRFLISGKYRCWEDKVIAINTPLIKEVDGYEHFNDVIKLVDNVYAEIDLYLSGAKSITKQEVIIDYMKDVKKKETFKMEDDFSSMNDEELKLMLKEIDKDLGIAVHLENGKLVIGTSEEEEVTEAQEVAAVSHTIEHTDDNMDLDLPIEMDSEVELDLDDIKDFQ